MRSSYIDANIVV